MPGLSGVGISFGADRIYDVMQTLDLFPKALSASVKVMFVNFGTREAIESLKYIKALRENGISAQLYPDAVKMKKQMALADTENIPYVAFVGESELGKENFILKNMSDGSQQTVTIDQAINILLN